jgi:hypothetical protein
MLARADAHPRVLRFADPPPTAVRRLASTQGADRTILALAVCRALLLSPTAHTSRGTPPYVWQRPVLGTACAADGHRRRGEFSRGGRPGRVDDGGVTSVAFPSSVEDLCVPPFGARPVRRSRRRHPSGYRDRGPIPDPTSPASRSKGGQGTSMSWLATMGTASWSLTRSNALYDRDAASAVPRQNSSSRRKGGQTWLGRLVTWTPDRPHP